MNFAELAILQDSLYVIHFVPFHSISIMGFIRYAFLKTCE